MNDIAYGTRQVIVTPDLGDKKSGRRGSFSFVGTPSIDMLDHNLIANLERGQNIFEIHFQELTSILVNSFNDNYPEVKKRGCLCTKLLAQKVS